MEWLILYIKGSQMIMNFCHEDCFHICANSADPGEMLHHPLHDILHIQF